MDKNYGNENFCAGKLKLLDIIDEQFNACILFIKVVFEINSGLKANYLQGISDILNNRFKTQMPDYYENYAQDIASEILESILNNKL
jgi:hypothetical protein